MITSTSRLLVTRTARPTKTVGTAYKTSIDLNQVRVAPAIYVVAWDYRTQPLRAVTMNGGEARNGGGQPGNSGGQPGVGATISPATVAVSPGDDWGNDQPGNGGGQPGDWGNDQPGNGVAQ